MDINSALAFISQKNKGVLITERRSGRPQASNIVYGTVEDRIGISVTADRVKTKNLQRVPTASLHVTSDDFWQWAVVDCDAELSPVAAAAGDETSALLRMVYEAAGGKKHPDWDEFDQAMIDEGVSLSC